MDGTIKRFDARRDRAGRRAASAQRPGGRRTLARTAQPRVDAGSEFVGRTS